MIIDKIKKDIVKSMKDKDKDRLSTLRMLISVAENLKIEKKLSNVEELTDNDIISCISKNIKTINQELEYLQKYDKDSSKQKNQKDILESYLPEQLSKNDIELEVNIIMYDISKENKNFNIGDVMKVAKVKMNGIADMGTVSKIAREQVLKFQTR